MEHPPTLKTDLREMAEVMGAYRSGEAFALTMSARTFLIDGLDGAGCADERCPNAITWEEIDEGFAAHLQPEGYCCTGCERWYCNAHGDRATRTCPACQAGTA